MNTHPTLLSTLTVCEVICSHGSFFRDQITDNHILSLGSQPKEPHLNSCEFEYSQSIVLQGKLELVLRDSGTPDSPESWVQLSPR